MVKLVREEKNGKQENKKKESVRTSEQRTGLIGACHKCSLFPSKLLDIA